MTWSLFTFVQVEAQVTPALLARTQEILKPWQTNIALTIQVKAAPGPPPKDLLPVDTVVQVRHDVKQNWHVHCRRWRSVVLSEKSAWQQVKAPPVLPGKAGEKSRTVCQADITSGYSGFGSWRRPRAAATFAHDLGPASAVVAKGGGPTSWPSFSSKFDTVHFVGPYGQT